VVACTVHVYKGVISVIAIITNLKLHIVVIQHFYTRYTVDQEGTIASTWFVESYFDLANELFVFNTV